MASGRSRLEIAALARLRRLYETPIPSRLPEPSTHSSSSSSSSSSSVLDVIRSRRPPTASSTLELWLTLHTLQRELQSDVDALRREVQLCDDQTAPSKRLQLTVDANTLGVTASKWLVLREVLGAATFHQYVRDVFRDVGALRHRAALYGERWRRFDECVRLGCIVGHERLLTSVSHERCLDLLNDALHRVALLVSDEDEEEEERDTQSLLLSETPVLVKHCSDPSAPQQIVVTELLELLGRLPPARERITRLCFEQLADARRGDGVAPPPDAVKAHRLVSLAKQNHAKTLASDHELDAVLRWLDGAGYRDVSMDSFLAWHIPQSDALVDEDAEFVSLLQRIWGFDLSSARYEQLHAVLANYESRQELVASRARKQDVLQRAEHAVTSVLPGRLTTLQQALAACATATFDRPGTLWELAAPYFDGVTVPSPLSTALTMSLSALQTLQLVGLELRSFPSVLSDESAFPVLEVLDLQSNRLANPLPRSMGRRKTLKTLLLAQNELDDACFPVDMDAWDGLTSLETLELSSNRLSRLPLVVSGLSGLKTLSLASNRLRDANALPPAVLQRWTANGCCLETLDLRENALTNVPSELFVATASTLERLFLQHNALESLPAAFTTLTRLHDVQLSHNRLSYLDGDLVALLSRCAQCHTVDVAHNQFLQFPLTVSISKPTSVASVRVLRMQDNRLRVLPSLTTSVSFDACEELWLQHNSIRLVPDDFFASFPSLRVCNLSENALRSLPDSVASCQRLETLDLHGNRLETAPAVLSSLVRLQVLNLRDNRLSSAPIEWHRFATHADAVTQRSPVLHTLQLQKNPLRNKVLRLLVDGDQRVSHHAFQTADTAVCEMYVRKLIDHLKQTMAVVALARAVHRDVDDEEEEEEEEEHDEKAEVEREATSDQRVRLRQRRWKGRARYVLQLLTQRLLETSDARVRLPSLRFQELLRKLQPASSKKEPQSTTTAILQYLQVAHEQRQQLKETKREETEAPEKPLTPLKAKSTSHSRRPTSANNNPQQHHHQQQQRMQEVASKKPVVDSSPDERRRELESRRQRERIRVLEQQLLDQQLLRLTEPPSGALVPQESTASSDSIVVLVRLLSPASVSSAPKSMELVVSRSARVTELKAAIARRLAIGSACSQQLFLIVRRPEDATNVRLGESDGETEIARWLSPGTRRLQVSVLVGETLRVQQQKQEQQRVPTPGERSKPSD